MQLSSGVREGLAIGIGAALGVTTIGAATVALTSDDASTKRIGTIVAGAGLATTAGLGALMLRSPGLRADVGYGALGFVGLPAMLATGLIQNARDSR